jgi:hypothetical protein
MVLEYLEEETKMFETETEQQEVIFDLSQKQNNPIREYNPDLEIQNAFNEDADDDEEDSDF